MKTVTQKLELIKTGKAYVENLKGTGYFFYYNNGQDSVRITKKTYELLAYEQGMAQNFGGLL